MLSDTVMPMNFSSEILKLILDASVVVQVIMALLVLASLVSWTVILIKSSQLSRAQRHMEKFEKKFWSGVSLDKLYDDLSGRKSGKIAQVGQDRIRKHVLQWVPRIPAFQTSNRRVTRSCSRRRAACHAGSGLA